MPNNRIFYAVQAIKIKPCQASPTVPGTFVYGSEVVPRGIQSVGVNTNFNLEQAYQLGQLSLYSNIEEVPDIEVTINNLLDGTRLMYNLALDGSGTVTGGNMSATVNSNNLGLTQIADRRCDFALGIWDDTSVSTNGAATAYAVVTGAYVSSTSFKFSTDGNFTEDLTLVSNNLKWQSVTGGGITNFNSGLPGNDTKRIARRWSLDTTNSILPTGSGGGIGGLTASNATLHINSITLTCNLGRESIQQLGLRPPYYRYLNVPVEVTSEFNVTAVSGAQVNADDFSTQTGCSASAAANLANFPIKIYICDPNAATTAYVFDLGTKSKLTSANQSGGDTGGGNVEITYSYQTFNDFAVSGNLNTF
jgi:hypothetical protein